MAAAADHALLEEAKLKLLKALLLRCVLLCKRIDMEVSYISASAPLAGAVALFKQAFLSRSTLWGALSAGNIFDPDIPPGLVTHIVAYLEMSQNDIQARWIKAWSDEACTFDINLSSMLLAAYTVHLDIVGPICASGLPLIFGLALSMLSTFCMKRLKGDLSIDDPPHVVHVALEVKLTLMRNGLLQRAVANPQVLPMFQNGWNISGVMIYLKIWYDAEVGPEGLAVAHKVDLVLNHWQQVIPGLLSCNERGLEGINIDCDVDEVQL